VARASGANIAISAPHRTDTTDGYTASLVVDPTHPYFFDHPCDHVPGMLLLEGCAQLALAAFAGTGGIESPGISAYEVSFTQFVEPAFETTLVARVEEQDAGRSPLVRLAIWQLGAACGTATFHLAPVAGY
jgi:3-hydroxymyristoyl/3-hydroxydecanoyl-(acyl carrier protein) dehydratase